MTKAIIFDLEGTLADTEPLHLKAHKRALADFGIKINEDDYIKEGAYKKSSDFYFKMSLKYNAEITETDLRKIKEEKKRYYLDLINEVTLYPGVTELLESLKQNYKLAIASATTREIIFKILSNAKIVNLFDVIISGEDVLKNKPSPDIYLKSSEDLEISPSLCVVVEDSETGVQSAKSANMKCIAVPNRYTKNQDFSKADIVLNDIHEVSTE